LGGIFRLMIECWHVSTILHVITTQKSVILKGCLQLVAYDSSCGTFLYPICLRLFFSLVS